MQTLLTADLFADLAHEVEKLASVERVQTDVKLGENFYEYRLLVVGHPIDSRGMATCNLKHSRVLRAGSCGASGERETLDVNTLGVNYCARTATSVNVVLDLRYASRGQVFCNSHDTSHVRATKSGPVAEDWTA